MAPSSYSPPSHRSKTVGLLFRLLQLAIIGYIVGYVIVYKKGYQEYDFAVSSVSTKVKGIGGTCRVPGVPLSSCADADVRIWDTVDYVIPAEENNALFIVTNSVEVPNQVQGIWDEDPHYATSYNCTTSEDCLQYKYNASVNGLVAEYVGCAV